MMNLFRMEDIDVMQSNKTTQGDYRSLVSTESSTVKRKVYGERQNKLLLVFINFICIKKCMQYVISMQAYLKKGVSLHISHGNYIR